MGQTNLQLRIQYGSPFKNNIPSAFYHVTSRGIERKAVSKIKRDRKKYLEYLESATLRYDARIHIYCLIKKL